jgi:hypothetical protein
VPGDSGAWVIQGSQVCGHVIAGRKSVPWVYMIPMEQIFQGIKSAFGMEDVKIPTAADIERLRLIDMGPTSSVTVPPQFEELQSVRSTATEPLRGQQGHPPSNCIPDSVQVRHFHEQELHIETPLQRLGFSSLGLDRNSKDDPVDSEKMYIPSLPPWNTAAEDLEKFQLQPFRGKVYTGCYDHSSISVFQLLTLCLMVFMVSITIASRKTTSVNEY